MTASLKLSFSIACKLFIRSAMISGAILQGYRTQFLIWLVLVSSFFLIDSRRSLPAFPLHLPPLQRNVLQFFGSRSDGCYGSQLAPRSGKTTLFFLLFAIAPSALCTEKNMDANQGWLVFGDFRSMSLSSLTVPVCSVWVTWEPTECRSQSESCPW